MNYQSWLAKWLETYVRPVVKGKTLETYRGVVKDHLVPALGELELAELTPARLQAFVAQQAKSGNRRTGEGLSCASVNLIITVLQNSLKCAREADMVGGYAAEKLRRPRSAARETACFDLSEQATLVRAAMQAKDEKFRGIVLCLYTGLRLGELLALEWGDVDWERGLLYVRRTCREGRDEAGRFGRIVGAPKSRRSVRVIPLSAEVRAMLRAMQKPSRLVISRGGAPLSVRSYQRSFARLLARLSLPHRGFHALRHTFATRAAECGMDGRALAEILGHGSPAFTFARYVHPLASYKADMMERLAARIRPCAGSVRVRAHSPFGDAECAVPVLCD